MEREYELFELLADGSPMWRGQASGLRDVRLKLQEIAKTTTNECFAMYLATKEIVARLNVGASSGVNGKPLIFQIYYDDRLATARAEVLRLHGYEVVSVAGNEAAKKYPGVRIIALNSPTIQELPGADYNIKLNGPQTWLPVIDSALGHAPGKRP